MAGKKRMMVMDEPKEAKPEGMTEEEITNFLARRNGGYFNLWYGDKGCLRIFQQGIIEVRRDENPPQPVEAVITNGCLRKTPQGWVFCSSKGVSLPVFALSSD